MSVEYVKTDETLPPVAVVERPRWTPTKIVIWVAIALIAAIGWVMVAFVRGENLSASWFVAAAVGSYLIAFRFYAKFIEWKICRPDPSRATPAELKDNGRDFTPTDRRVLFGHHFAAISGAGPLVGPILAAQMGYLPGTLWIIFGVIIAGGVQDYMVLYFSMRRNGRSLGQMARDELGRVGGFIASVGILLIMTILIAVLGVVIINALAESPWGVFSIAMTIPIAVFMGVYMRYLRPGRVIETSVIGVALLVLAIIAGGWVHNNPVWAEVFHLDKTTLAWCLMIYGFFAAVLPVWVLLAPRDYLSTFMKIGTIVLLAVGILVVNPTVQMPAITEFASNTSGPAFAGALFPFLFITIACGALSGFHALISSGTTPKLIEKESQARLIGYGGMLMESFVAIMALVAAVCLDKGIYFAMNAAEPLTGGTPQGAADFINNSLGMSGVQTSAEFLEQTAQDVGEESIVSRTGGAPTLAMGMAHILHNVFGGPAWMSFWYHFAVMFEALFILTTIDAGTRVARFMLGDALGNFIPKFRDPSWNVGAWITTIVMVGAWGSILLMGVTDPLGGINTLFPLFGISNQLLAAIALAVVFALVCKSGYAKYAWIPGIPLVWDLAVTMTASWQKIFSSDPKLGYWAQHVAYRDAVAAGETSLGTTEGVEAMNAVVRNTFIQGTLSIIFAVVVLMVVVMALWAAFKSITAREPLPTTEEPYQPTRRFAPAGLIATKAEKEVRAQWDKLEPSAVGQREHS
ncbi:carbon starvation protein A [Nocardia zapadnayensis]|uniref:carbon starvation CstA family protein n=1 Tax=unclassified Brevibacterium TaxID=2614124 RepID=UPI001FF70AB0|nr:MULTISPECIES: carbon starvation CstA family protein [Actinomycetes]MCK1803199.1 carbon starvation protein A [Brevibacterium sp. R8603A2]MCX0277110.1 carbon starvation protein A [Nocardia zapadnayensis]